MTDLITSTKSVISTGDQKVDGLFSGTAWDGTITYAFPTTSSSYADDGFDIYYEKYYSFTPISSQQKSLALFFMEQSYGSAANDGFSVEGFTNANFEAGSAGTATVRFAQTSDPYLDTAGAYLPAVDGRGGDIWFGTGYAGTEDDYRFPRFGNYAGQTLAHELGHALGLKHAHQGVTVVPSAYDSLEYTIMTYHTFIGDNESGAKYEHDGAPQTFMMLDIAALQEMYGADYTTNSGDTVYKWNPNQGITYVNGVAAITPAANRIFATIWDGGGIDTYDLSAYTTALKIDLRAGGYSVFSQGQLSYLGGGPNNGYARGNIFNALLHEGNTASLIENVKAGSGNDSITGNEADNTLWGNAGNDTLNGLSGNDTLIGGTGNDTYIVDVLADVVTEGLNEGTDLIKTALSSYALTNIANVENLTFIGTGAFTGTGSGLANTITGGSGNDTLDGGAGNDTLIGGAGNDLYVVDASLDLVIESANKGTDTVQTAISSYTLSNNVENLTYTGSASFTGTGNALANTITGGAGNDTLNGGVGADTLIGGAGDDTYIVDNAFDVVTEGANAGTDTVRTTLASYTLGTDVENLTYIGTGTFIGTGNSFTNTINGGAGADILDGKAGADSLIGGAGNDTYIVDNLGDVVTEGLNAGTDLIKTALSSYTLGTNVENLQYTGSASFIGTGNTLVNTITGGAGNDTLDGGIGNDTLNGGAGNDIYVV
ncbi:M10 family metallopeptidase, partial [Rhizobium sp. CBN3]|uniref:M10 family metallopeptidase n=1 Tax=Rhizobium sp. CBN3 TaxID=3058045 RepID=UPI002670DED5